MNEPRSMAPDLLLGRGRGEQLRALGFNASSFEVRRCLPDKRQRFALTHALAGSTCWSPRTARAFPSTGVLSCGVKVIRRRLNIDDMHFMFNPPGAGTF
jgi:hypothetical protein